MDSLSKFWVMSQLNQGWIHYLTMIGTWVSAFGTAVLAIVAVWTARRVRRLHLNARGIVDNNQFRVDVVNLGWSTEVVDEIRIGTGMRRVWDKWWFKRVPARSTGPIEGWSPDCPSTHPHVRAGEAIQFCILKSHWDRNVISLIPEEQSDRASIDVHVWVKTASGYRASAQIPCSTSIHT